MTKKSYIALIVIMSALMFYGCGDDDDDDGGTPPPGAGVCQGCPCNYFDVPMTESCWKFAPNFKASFIGDNYTCSLTKPPPGLTLIEYEAPQAACTNFCVPRFCHIDSPPPCSPSQVSIALPLSQAQVNDCRACLEQYVTQLNAIIPVNAPGGLKCPVNP